MTERGWVLAWRGDGEAQAHAVAGGLRMAGISARVGGHRPLPIVAHAWVHGRWVIEVPAEQHARAIAHLQRTGEGANAITGQSGDHVAENARLLLRYGPLIVLAAVLVIAWLAMTGS